MFDRIGKASSGSSSAPSREAPSEDNGWGAALDVSEFANAARRQARVVAYCVAFSIVPGIMYVGTAVPLYTATVNALIDSRKNQDQLAASIAELTLDTGAIDSQVEVINPTTSPFRLFKR